MSPKGMPPRCAECGQSLSGAPNSFRTLAQENDELRQQVDRLREEILYWNEGGFVSSDTATAFHRPECKWALEINPKSMIEFVSYEEAVRRGKKPCKSCPS